MPCKNCIRLEKKIKRLRKKKLFKKVSQTKYKQPVPPKLDLKYILECHFC